MWQKFLHHIQKHLQTEDAKVPDSKEEIPDLSKADYDMMRQLLSEVDWHEQLVDKNASEGWKIFSEIVLGAMRQSIPMKIRRKSSQPMWMRKNTQVHLQKVQALETLSE